MSSIPLIADALPVAGGLDAPALHAAAVTPSNSVDLPTPCRALWVGGAGDVKADMLGGETGIVFVGVPAGTLLPFRFKRIYATGTSATSLVAGW